MHRCTSPQKGGRDVMLAVMSAAKMTTERASWDWASDWAKRDPRLTELRFFFPGHPYRSRTPLCWSACLCASSPSNDRRLSPRRHCIAFYLMHVYHIHISSRGKLVLDVKMFVGAKLLHCYLGAGFCFITQHTVTRRNMQAASSYLQHSFL